MTLVIIETSFSFRDNHNEILLGNRVTAGSLVGKTWDTRLLGPRWTPPGWIPPHGRGGGLKRGMEKTRILVHTLVFRVLEKPPRNRVYH